MIFSVTSSVTIYDTGSMSIGSSFLVVVCTERHKDIFTFFKISAGNAFYIII